MRKVAVIGAAMGRIGRYPELMFQDLGWPAIKGAIEVRGATILGLVMVDDRKGTKTELVPDEP